RPLHYGISAMGGTPHLVGEMLSRVTGVPLESVPYKGEQEGLLDLMAGRIAIQVGNPLTHVPLAKDGKLKMLAVTSAERSPLTDELPTLVEQGVQIVMGSFYGASLIAGTPNDIVTRLHAMLLKTLES